MSNEAKPNTKVGGLKPGEKHFSKPVKPAPTHKPAPAAEPPKPGSK